MELSQPLASCVVRADDRPEPRQEAAATSVAGIVKRGERFSRGLDRVIDPRFDPLGITIDEPISAVEALIGGRRTLLFGTNSYLGLNFHPACVAAAVAATQRAGTGSTASRAAGGTSAEHLRLEADLCRFHDRRHAVVFSTGFMANLGVISGITRRGDAILLDSHVHASIVDAARTSGATVLTFRHNDSGHLAQLLRQSEVPGERSLVVVEGLYSVWGDLGELRGILTTAKDFGAVTLVDEAHSVGIYGNNGRGVLEHAGVEHLADLVVGTFSKSIGVIGGYCVTNLDEFRSLRVMARPYLYTASLPPGVVAAARAALRQLPNPELRDALWRNATQLRDGIEGLGLPIIAPLGPIASIRMGHLKAVLECWQALLERGVYVSVLIPPAAPNGEAVLRFSVSAAHTSEQIQQALAALQEVLGARPD